ncbi:hypothetical protein ACS0TY_035403 [Phlomoides rotata]
MHSGRLVCINRGRGKGRGRGSGMWHVYIKIWIDCLIRFFNLDFDLFLIMHTFILTINVIVKQILFG